MQTSLSAVALFKARCRQCHHRFSSPHTSDFSYGEFIFTGERGTIHVCFFAPDHAVWKYIDALLPSYSDDPQCEKIADLLISACAFFADTIGGQRLLSHAVCPVCFSNHIKISDERTGIADIQQAAYAGFMAMPEEVRRRAVVEFMSAAQDPQ